MATLQVPQNGKVAKGQHRKTPPNVDLTAMVDLAFLLITFFMLTTSLSKNNGMPIVKPVPITDLANLQLYPASRTMTIVLAKNNTALCYLGEAGKTKMKVVKMSSLQKEIHLSKALVAQKHHNKPDKYMLVIVKPTSTSKYKNFVDAMDEINIANIKAYAIDDKYINADEKAFLYLKNL